MHTPNEQDHIAAQDDNEETFPGHGDDGPADVDPDDDMIEDFDLCDQGADD